MPRYNTALATSIINGATSISSPNQGAFTALTGTAPYTVTLPNPGLFPGANQTFYNSTGGTVTLSTPSGSFVGTGGSGTNTLPMYNGNVASVTSDGTNYIVISEDGSALVATTGTFSGDVTMNGGSATVSITPSTLTISPVATSTMNNVIIGGTTRAAGSFTSLNANNQANFTANITSSSTSTGTLVVSGGVGVSGQVTASTVTATTLTGTLSTASQTNITSVGTLSGLTVGGDININSTAFGLRWNGNYLISTLGNHIPGNTGFISATGGTNYASGWYRIARSQTAVGGNGLRGGAKITVGSTGGFLAPLMDVIYLFKDWTTTGQIGRVENYTGSYFTRYRITMDATVAYLEAFLGNSINLGGTSGWQCTAEPYSGNWNADNWTIYNETLTAGLASPTASYTIPVYSGGTSMRRLLLDRETESSSSPSLEIRINGGITTGNYEGLYFTQGVDGATPLASIRMANKSSGYPDLEFYTRSAASAESIKVLIANDGRVGIGTTDFSYTSSDNSAVVAGGLNNNRLFVNGSIQLLNNADAIVIGRGTSSFFKDEEIGFGWGGGWHMTDSTYLRVRNDKVIYSTNYNWHSGLIAQSSVGANSASGNTIGSYVLGNGRWWNTAGGAQYIHFLLPSRYNSGNSLMWCLEIKGYDFARPGIINIMIGGYVTPPSNGGPMSRVATWDAQSYYSPTAYYSSNYACGVARIYMPDRYYASFTVNSIASGNGDVIAPNELRIIESGNATI